MRIIIRREPPAFPRFPTGKYKCGRCKSVVHMDDYDVKVARPCWAGRTGTGIYLETLCPVCESQQDFEYQPQWEF